MAWTDLKAAVAAVIKTNGNQEITGALLQSTLNSIIDQVGANATYKGVAIPSTVPGTPDAPVFYLSSEKGTYANFGGVINYGDLCVIYNSGGSWSIASALSPFVSNNYLVPNTQLYYPSTANPGIAYDLSKAIKSFNIVFKSSFKKQDGVTVRKIKIRSCSRSTGGVVSMGIDIENVNDTGFTSIGITTDATGVMYFNHSIFDLYIEVNKNMIFSSLINTVATWEQGGFNPILIKKFHDLYELRSDVSVLESQILALDYLYNDIPLTLTDFYLSATGDAVPARNWRVSQFIDVTVGELIKYIGNTLPGGAAKSLWGYDSAGDPVSEIIGTGDYSAGITVPVPAGVSKIRGCSYYANTFQIKRVGSPPAVAGKKFIQKRINWVGMSIWWYDGNVLGGTGIIARGYQTLLKEQFKFLSDSATNYCYSGNSLGGLTVGDTSSIMTKTGWTGSTGDIWTLDSITNDFKRNIPIGTISDYDNATGITTFYGALRAFKDKVISLSGVSATIICSNALRRNNSGYTSTSVNTAGHTLVDYEKAMITVATKEKWYFVDQFRLSGVTDDNILIVSLDGLHINNMGYTLAILPWVQTLDLIYNKSLS